MSEFTLIRKNLLRKPLRFLLMYVVIAVAFLLFGLLQSVQSVMAGGSEANQGNRLIVSNRINFTQPLPYAYTARVAALPGAEAVAHATWFGGYYQEPYYGAPYQGTYYQRSPYGPYYGGRGY